jgi:hypothetical protein
VLEHAGVDHDHNAPNHGHNSAATAHANDDYYDAYGRRLLIAEASRCWHGLWAVFAFRKTVRNRLGTRAHTGQIRPIANRWLQS